MPSNGHDKTQSHRVFAELGRLQAYEPPKTVEGKLRTKSKLKPTKHYRLRK